MTMEPWQLNWVDEGLPSMIGDTTINRNGATVLLCMFWEGVEAFRCCYPLLLKQLFDDGFRSKLVSKRGVLAAEKLLSFY